MQISTETIWYIFLSSNETLQVRWTESSKHFQDQITRLVGDVLLATGFLSYSGPFNQEYRNLLLQMWKEEMSSNKIPFSDVSELLEIWNDFPILSKHILQPSTLNEWTFNCAILELKIWKAHGEIVNCHLD